MEIPLILKGSSAQQKNSNARHAISLVITQAFAPKEIPAKTSQLQAQEPTAHQLKAGTIHAHDSNEVANSSDDSFHLQLKIQCTQAHNKMTPKPIC